MFCGWVSDVEKRRCDGEVEIPQLLLKKRLFEVRRKEKAGLRTSTGASRVDLLLQDGRRLSDVLWFGQ